MTARTARRVLPSLLLALALMAPAPSAATPRTASGAVADIPTGARVPRVARARIANVSSAGGPVLHSNRTHLIFWQPSGSGLSFERGYVALVKTFLRQVAADSGLPGNIFGLTGQYRDADGPAVYDSTYAGAVLDTDPLPPGGCAEPPPPRLGGQGPGWTMCVSDQQLQDELIRVVTAHRLPTRPTDVFFLVTPNGLGDCFGTGPSGCALGGLSNDGYCGYHQITQATGILYAVIPYNAVANHCQSANPRPNSSPADPTISTVAHELAEIVTDPLGTSWLDASQSGAGDLEIADLCLTRYGPLLGGSAGASAYDQLIHGGRYFIQELWSNADGRCLPAARADSVSVTVPRTVPGDRRLTLRSTALAAHGRIVSFSWSFGDGARGSGRRVWHAYAGTGRYAISLRTTDSWGNRASVSRPVTVTRPGPPTARISGGPRRVTGLRGVRFRFASDAAIARFYCRVDRQAWVGCRSPYSSSPLARGPHTFAVRARDTFGQLGRAAAVYRFTAL